MDDETSGARTPEELKRESDDLLGAVDHLKALERQKRDTVTTSDRFHHLADRVEDEARRVFRIAADERDDATVLRDAEERDGQRPTQLTLDGRPG